MFNFCKKNILNFSILFLEAKIEARQFRLLCLSLHRGNLPGGNELIGQSVDHFRL
jgi:hypothetical protein